MEKIRLAIVGVGNCASSLVQGIEYYRTREGAEKLGLMHFELGGYQPGTWKWWRPSMWTSERSGDPWGKRSMPGPMYPGDHAPGHQFQNHRSNGTSPGRGLSPHAELPEDQTFVLADAKPCDVEKVLRDSGVEILLNYLPVGSESAARFYATCCLNTGVSLINCMPVFLVSSPEWGRKFAERRIPVVGDDVKAQLGATILHRALTQLFVDRGVKVDRTYQLNVGGNTDFSIC